MGSICRMSMSKRGNTTIIVESAALSIINTSYAVASPKALPTKLSSHYKPVQVPAQLVPVVFVLLNSQLF
jgi:hypothetical protein